MVLFRLKLAGPPAPIVDVRSLARDAAVLIGECCARDFDVAFFFWSLSSSNQFSHLDCLVLSLSRSPTPPVCTLLVPVLRYFMHVLIFEVRERGKTIREREKREKRL